MCSSTSPTALMLLKFEEDNGSLLLKFKEDAGDEQRRWQRRGAATVFEATRSSSGDQIWCQQGATSCLLLLLQVEDQIDLCMCVYI